MERLDSLLCRLEKATIILEAAAVNSMYRTSPIKTSSESGNPLSVKEFHDIITGPLSEYVLYSSKIGDVVKTHASVVERCFLMEEEILKLASECSKPSDSELTLIMTLLGKEIEEVVKLKDNNRSNRFFNHLSAVAESVAALGWLSVSPAPAPYIKTMKEAAEFFTNRVIKEYEEKDTVHLAWKKALMSVLTALELYVKKHHTTGLVWNARGKPATASKLSKSSPTREVNSNCSVALPPPPALTPAHLAAISLQGKNQSPQSALFSDINRGEAVTSNLRKVTDDMKTHKNPKLREGPIMHTSRHQVNSSLNNTIIRSPAEKKGCLELKGNKWVVEYFNSVENLEVIITEPKQTVFIYKCNECTIRIKGKANSIMLDNCKKTGVVFDYLISSIDVVNCQSIQIQCLGKLSTVNIDKTDGCQVFLNEDSKYADVITAKSSEVNLLVPNATGHIEEFAVPEQFKTNFTGNGLKTVCTDSR
ncbi:Adenylyl cyclase-associated protein isoform 3 [Schistosoma japonicum]|uniref:Adenylyl cyclase-associated protein isoform 3 n=1 Tax=Schistosoma japonicum TaxID=6182 RepID=A0A4Z2D1K2_SCHJA|nr:Adenylyl cyclase-associated protein 1 [Schistosoma japonicum]TNN10385.1 Adenylyl cyclase-associated protein isoform 3 [Schistosoma japonicum]